jgi:N-acyl-L-homoserine lactone synthetase
MYRYVRVESNVDRQDWLRTRQNVYLDAGLITVDDLVHGVYQDSFDERCHHILACEQDGEPAGSARLIVRDGDSAPLHLEGHFPMHIEPNSAEISGFTVVSAHRQTKVLAGLARALFEVAREEQITWLYAEVEPPFLKLIQRIGFPFEAVTEQKWIYNAWNFVIRLSVPGFVSLVDEMVVRGQGNVLSQLFAHPFEFQLRRDVDEAVVLSLDGEVA